jgi:hypothetical protein
MAKRLLISRPLGDDVTLVWATLLDTLGPGDLLRQHPGSVIIWFSAIGYPAPGMAVISFFSAGAFGAARTERLPDGAWRVAVQKRGPPEGGPRKEGRSEDRLLHRAS